MATIDTFSIDKNNTTKSLNKVYFNLQFSSSSSKPPVTSGEGATGYSEEGHTWSFVTSTGQASTALATAISGSCQYTRGGEGKTQYKITGTLSYTKINKEWQRKFVDWDYVIYDHAEYGYGIREIVSGNSITVYEYYDRHEDELGNYTYIYYVEYYELVYKETSREELEVSKSFNFYPHPAEFKFTGCTSGATWKIDDGLNSLITNIEEFQPQAQQWKSWKNQSAASACPSFANSEGYLAALSMNSVYNYVGKGTPWKSGDEISAAMFNDLAAAINN